MNLKENMMDCLTRLEIQQYIDGEVNKEELNSFVKHKEKCAQCSQLWYSAIREISEVNDMISLARPLEESVRGKVPVFRNFIVLASAAAGLVLTLLLQYNAIREKNENRIRADMEMHRLLLDSDPNLMWVEKQTIIITTDKNGNLIESEL